MGGADLNMDSAAFEAFVAVAETGSFSRAAERLELTQSAVSKRLSNLEHGLAATLFDRIGRQAQLTESGRVLLPHARNVLADLAAGRQAVADLAGTVGGRLQLATSHHVGLHRLPPILREYAAAYPNVDLDLRFMESEEACAAVAAGELELAVITLPEAAAPQLTTEVLWHDPLAFVAAGGHPVAAEGRLQPSDLAAEPAILPDSGTFTRRIVRDVLQPYAIEPRVAFETNYLETIKMMVSVGLGWSVLPKSMLADADLAILDVADITLARRLGMVRHKGRTVGNAVGAFQGVARRHADRQRPG